MSEQQRNRRSELVQKILAHANGDMYAEEIAVKLNCTAGYVVLIASGDPRAALKQRQYRSNRPSGPWTDERVDILKKLWAEGLSASQIAGRLGGVTRNAVIGKADRLGLSGRATTSRLKSGCPPKRNVDRFPKEAPVASARKRAKTLSNVGFLELGSAHSIGPEPFTPKEDLVIPEAERKSIQSLEENHCRWPIGDPQADDFHFCGKTKVPGLPYCDFHCKRAFQPRKRRDNDANLTTNKRLENA